MFVFESACVGLIKYLSSAADHARISVRAKSLICGSHSVSESESVHKHWAVAHFMTEVPHRSPCDHSPFKSRSDRDESTEVGRCHISNRHSIFTHRSKRVLSSHHRYRFDIDVPIGREATHQVLTTCYGFKYSFTYVCRISIKRVEAN